MGPLVVVLGTVVVLLAAGLALAAVKGHSGLSRSADAQRINQCSRLHPELRCLDDLRAAAGAAPSPAPGVSSPAVEPPVAGPTGITVTQARVVTVSPKSEAEDTGSEIGTEPAPVPTSPPAVEEPLPAPPLEEPAPTPPVVDPPAEEPPSEEPPSVPPDPEPEPKPEPEPEPEPEEPRPGPSPALLFDGAFSSGFPRWYLQAPAGRVSLVSGSPYSGQSAARFEVRQGEVEPDTGSSRAEVSGPTYDEGDDIYVRDAIRIPAADSHSSSWQLINQLHETDWGKSPGIAVMLGNDLSLSLSNGDGSPFFWRGPALQRDRWYELVYRVKLSRDPGQGFVEVWLDGSPQQLQSGGTRMYGETILTEHTYLKVGIYRAGDSSGTSLVEHAGVAVSSSLASFLPG